MFAPSLQPKKLKKMTNLCEIFDNELDYKNNNQFNYPSCFNNQFNYPSCLNNQINYSLCLKSNNLSYYNQSNYLPYNQTKCIYCYLKY